MTAFIDLTGKRFGHLTVISRAENSKTGKTRWNCVCDCGKHTVSYTESIRRGRTISCGCEGHRRSAAARRKHGENKTKLHNEWQTIRSRCRGDDAHRKKYYKDRGITVCDEWNEYTKFRDWALANGYKEGLQIDRIDNDKGYCPENCRWVTRKRNMRNTRKTIIVTYHGKTQPLIDFAEEYGVDRKLAWQRYKKGLPLEKVLYKGNLRNFGKDVSDDLHLEDLPF